MKEEIERRFNQDAMEILVCAETLIEKAVQGEKAPEEFQRVAQFWRGDLDHEDLQNELRALRAFSPQIKEPKSLKQVRDWLAQLPASVRPIFHNLEALVRLLLVLPPSTAGAERTFSLLRRLKTWLRGTMAQARLNHLAIIATYKEEVQKISDTKIAKEFV